MFKNSGAVNLFHHIISYVTTEHSKGYATDLKQSPQT